MTSEIKRAYNIAKEERRLCESSDSRTALRRDHRANARQRCNLDSRHDRRQYLASERRASELLFQAGYKLDQLSVYSPCLHAMANGLDLDLGAHLARCLCELEAGDGLLRVVLLQR